MVRGCFFIHAAFPIRRRCSTPPPSHFFIAAIAAVDRTIPLDFPHHFLLPPVVADIPCPLIAPRCRRCQSFCSHHFRVAHYHRSCFSGGDRSLSRYPLFDGTLPARTIHSSESLTWTIEYNNQDGLLELRECFWRGGDLFIFIFSWTLFRFRECHHPQVRCIASLEGVCWRCERARCTARAIPFLDYSLVFLTSLVFLLFSYTIYVV